MTLPTGRGGANRRHRRKCSGGEKSGTDRIRKRQKAQATEVPPIQEASSLHKLLMESGELTRRRGTERLVTPGAGTAHIRQRRALRNRRRERGRNTTRPPIQRAA